MKREKYRVWREKENENQRDREIVKDKKERYRKEDRREVQKGR